MAYILAYTLAVFILWQEDRKMTKQNLSIDYFKSTGLIQNAGKFTLTPIPNRGSQLTIFVRAAE